MSTDQNSTPHTPQTKAELQTEIEQLRHSLGDTVEELTYRFDVKARAKEKVRSVPSYVPAGLAAAVAVGLGLWLWKRHGD